MHRTVRMGGSGTGSLSFFLWLLWWRGFFDFVFLSGRVLFLACLRY